MSSLRSQVSGSKRQASVPRSTATHTSNRTPQTSSLWRRQLDKLLRHKTPLGLRDFPQLDEDIQEAFAEGVAVADYFDDTVRGELQDLGFPYQDLDDEEVQERFEESLAELEAQGFAGLGERTSRRRP